MSEPVLSQKLESYRILFHVDRVKVLKYMTTKTPVIHKFIPQESKTFLLPLRTCSDLEGTHFDVVISVSPQCISSTGAGTEDLSASFLLSENLNFRS